MKTKEEQRVFKEWGFTNDPADLCAVQRWRDAAILDGWSSAQRYGNETIESACELTRDGFMCSILTRSNDRNRNKWSFTAKISIWGPDGLAIRPPATYSMEEIRAGLRTCFACGATDVDTQPVGFAGRVCEACLPEQRRIHEYPGWTN